MNRKAQNFLMPEVLKMIVALACIIILIAVAYIMYGLLTNKTESEQAKSTLNNIAEIASGLKEGQVKDYLIVSGPPEWALVYYAKGDAMPRSCYGKNCLCLCQAPGGESREIRRWMVNNKDYCDVKKELFSNSEGISGCEKTGVCKTFEESIKIRPWCYQILNDIGGAAVDPSPLNWFKLLKEKMPVLVYIQKDEKGVSIGEDLPLGISFYKKNEGTPLFDSFLAKEIDDNGKKVSIREFILNNLAGNCKDEKFRASEEDKTRIASEMRSFFLLNYKIKPSDQAYRWSFGFRIVKPLTKESGSYNPLDDVWENKEVKEYDTSARYDRYSESIPLCKEGSEEDYTEYDLELDIISKSPLSEK